MNFSCSRYFTYLAAACEFTIFFMTERHFYRMFYTGKPKMFLDFFRLFTVFVISVIFSCKKTSSLFVLKSKGKFHAVFEEKILKT